jgi:DNA-directed RNA polymerase specialized sigma24 family protein
MLPSLSNSRRPDLVANGHEWSSDQDTSLKYLQGLPIFDRFVFVMSVLERYSDRDCALLLGCASADILPARIRAFRQMSTRVENSYPALSSGAQAYIFDPDWLEC